MSEIPSDNSLKVLSALEAGQYEVFYTAPKCVEEHKHNDGSAYYVVKSQRNDRGGVKISVCGFEYILKYQDYFSAWEGLGADNPKLAKALSQRVRKCWGPCIESADIIYVYKKARHLHGVVEWYDECSFDHEKLEEFLDDEVVRYKLIEVWFKLHLLGGDIALRTDISLNPRSIIHWLVMRYYRNDSRAKRLLLDFMRTGIELPVLQYGEEYYPPSRGNPYPPELYAEADYPILEGGDYGCKVITRSELNERARSIGF